jgi:hypothetical protein
MWWLFPWQLASWLRWELSFPRLPEQFRDLPQPEESPEVMVLRRADGQWRSMLNGTLLGDVGIAEDPVSGD